MSRDWLLVLHQVTACAGRGKGQIPLQRLPRDKLETSRACIEEEVHYTQLVKARFHYSDFLETSSKLVGFKFRYSDFPETNSNEFVSSLSRTCLEFVSRKLETSRASFGVSNGQSSKPTRTNHLDMSRWSVRVSS